MTHPINKKHTLVLLVLIGALAPLSADAYLPALSLLSDYFQTSDKMLKFSVTAYFIGFAGAQVLFGPLSDAYGRKVIILIGIGIGALGALICFLSHSIYSFYLGRFVLGIGMASGIPVARAVLKDLFDGKALSQAATQINMVFAVMPFITPLMGAYLATYFPWQSIFQMVFIACVTVFFLTFFYLKESNQELTPELLIPGNLSRAFIKVAQDKQVFIYGFSTLCAFACTTAYMVSAPYIFLNILGLSMIEFGWLAGLVTVSYLVGGMINNQLIKRFSSDHIIFMAFITLLFAAFSMAISLLLWGVQLLAMIITVFILMLASRMVLPNALAGAFTSKQKEVGIISSVYGLYHTMGAVLASGMIALLPVDAASALIWVLILFSGIGLIVFSISKKQSRF